MKTLNNDAKKIKQNVVYTHSRVTDYQPFYVGCSTNMSRPYSYSSRNDEWNKIAEDNTIEVKIIASFNSIEDAFEYEEFLIKKYGRTIDGGTLVNQTLGNTGTRGLKKNRVRKSNALIFDKYTNTFTTTSILNRNSPHCKNYYYRLANGTRGKNERFIFVDLLTEKQLKELQFKGINIDSINIL